MTPVQLLENNLVVDQKYYYLYMDADTNLPTIGEMWYVECASINHRIVGNWFKYIIEGGTLPYYLRYLETREVIGENFDVVYETLEEAEMFKRELVELSLCEQYDIIDAAKLRIEKLMSIL